MKNNDASRRAMSQGNRSLAASEAYCARHARTGRPLDSFLARQFSAAALQWLAIAARRADRVRKDLPLL